MTDDDSDAPCGRIKLFGQKLSLPGRHLVTFCEIIAEKEA